jgi:hypothetical protein
MARQCSPFAGAASDPTTNALARSVQRAKPYARPFPHWRLRRLFPEAVARALAAAPFVPPDLSSGSGRRELHNAQRTFLAGEAIATPGPLRAVALAFQSPGVVAALVALTGVMLAGSFLRIECALDLDGFWLEPHTDLGVKLFTLLIGLPDGPRQAGLGTDLYDARLSRAVRPRFCWNAGIAFVPGAETWHGFAPRPIEGVRRSVIVNYVTQEWRARRELAFPDRPVTAPATALAATQPRAFTGAAPST